MNTISFHCSKHGQQSVSALSVGMIASVPVRIMLKCGCCWVWRGKTDAEMRWEQVKQTCGLAEIARVEHGPYRD